MGHVVDCSSFYISLDDLTRPLQEVVNELLETQVENARLQEEEAASAKQEQEVKQQRQRRETYERLKQEFDVS